MYIQSCQLLLPIVANFILLTVTLTFLELETNRVFRSDIFNIIVHRRNVAGFARTPAEDRVMIGASNRYERTLLQKSPLVKELIFGEHDHRMLGAGFKEFHP